MKDHFSNRKKNNRKGRLLAGLLVLVMLASLFPEMAVTSAYADEVIAESASGDAVLDETAAEETEAVESTSEETGTEEPVSDETGAGETVSDEIVEETAEEAEEETTEEPVILNDETYGVSVEIPAESLPEGIEKENIGLRVSELTQEQTEEALELLEKTEEELLAAYDISLYDISTEEDIQPSGKVNVTIPEIEGIEEQVAVHRINDDETVTMLSGTVENESEVVFETDHFTPYTITTENNNLTYLKKIINEAESGSTITINLSADIDWDLDDSTSLVKIKDNKTVIINGNNKIIRNGVNSSTGTIGTMFHVEYGSTLTLNNVTLDGGWKEFVGNGDYGWNGINVNVKGVFIYNEGTVNLNDGAILTKAHTSSSTTKSVGRDKGTYTKGLSKLVAPIVCQGGTLNMYSGSKITGNWFTANPLNGGNYYSAGAIIGLPSTDGTRKSVINMYPGAEISSNKVGFDYQEGTYEDANNANIYLPASEMSGNRVGDSFFYGGCISNDTDRPTKYNVQLRTPGSGAILLLSSDMNMYGGTIDGNYGETGGIALNGVSTTFKDLYATEHPSYESELLSWKSVKENFEGAERDNMGVGLSVSQPVNLTSTLNLMGGTISNNLGISNGGIYAGRYATVNVGTESEIAGGKDDTNSASTDNGSIIISNNTSYNDYGGAGISVSSQLDPHWGETGFNDSSSAVAELASSGQPYRYTGQPVLNLYSATIEKNTSSRKGGGIYIGTNEAHLYGGLINNNTAYDEGGGIYADAGYSVTFTTVTEIANNRATVKHIGHATDEDYSALNAASNGKDRWFTSAERALLLDGANYGKDGHNNNSYTAGYVGLGAGGGVWLCPEGQSTFDNTGLVLIHDNSADTAGDDLYNVVDDGMLYNNLIKLPASDAVGGQVLWFRDGGYNLDNLTDEQRLALITRTEGFRGAVGTDLLRVLIKNENGSWTWYDPDEDYDFYERTTKATELIRVTGQTSVYDQLGVKAVYNAESLRLSQQYVQLTITNNTSARGGGLASNARVTMSAEPTSTYEDNTIEIQKEWGEDVTKQTVHISAGYYSGDTFIEVASADLTSENGYKGELTGIPSVTTSGVTLFTTTIVKNDDGTVKSAKSIPTDKLVILETYKDSDGNTVAVTENKYIQSVTFVESEDQTVIEDTTTYNGAYKNTRVKFTYSTTVANYTTSYKDVTVNKIWGEGTTKEEVEVQLYEVSTDSDGNPVETAVENDGAGNSGTQKLNEGNTWSYTWTGLDKSKTYTVKETSTGNYVATVGSTETVWKEIEALYPGAYVVLGVAKEYDTDGDGTKENIIAYLGLDESGDAIAKGLLTKDSSGKVIKAPEDAIWNVVEPADGNGYYLINVSTGKKLVITGDDSTEKLTTLDKDATEGFTADRFNFDVSAMTLGVFYINSSGGYDYAVKDLFTDDLTSCIYDKSSTPKLYSQTSDVIEITNTLPDKGQFKIKKVSSEDTTVTLQGAEFDLYEVSDAEGAVDIIGSSDKGVKVNTDTLVTDSSGSLSFTGLDYGTYYIIETKAPDNYTGLAAPIKVVVSESGTKLDGTYSGVTLIEANASDVVGDDGYTLTNHETATSVNGVDTAEWTICLNPGWPEPRGIDGYTLINNISQNKMAEYTNTKELTETQYMQIKRALYWYIQRRGTFSTESNALSNLQRAIWYIVGETSYGNESLYSSSTHPELAELLWGDNPVIDDPSNDDVINATLKLDLYASSKSNYLGNQYQNMITASLVSADSKAIDVVQVENTPIPEKGEIQLKKVSSANTSSVLADAEFDLYMASDEGAVIDSTGISEKVIKINTETQKTDTNGLLGFTDLVYGTYYIVETKAPDNYIRLDTPIKVIVNANGTSLEGTVYGVTMLDATDGTTIGVIQVENAPKEYELPNAGGAGTFMMMLAALILLAGAGVFVYLKLIAKRRAR